jgi:hypothetical protein
MPDTYSGVEIVAVRFSCLGQPSSVAVSKVNSVFKLEVKKKLALPFQLFSHLTFFKSIFGFFSFL